MSLQVWLPLNGNLDNQGLGNITITNNGAIIDNTGKIGKCYSFNGNNYYIGLAGQDLFNCFKGGTNQFSICMWVYHADTRRAILFGDYATSGGVGFNIELSTGHAVRFYWNGSPDYSPSGLNVGASTWKHIAITYDGSVLKSYLNGVLVTSRAGALGALNKTSGEFRLGRDNRTTDTALNGKLNDIRIYNHCLSVKEVEEISKGLILHYKLDDSQSESTTNLVTSITSGGQTTVSNNIVTTSGSNADTYFTLNLSESIVNGTQYTISCYAEMPIGTNWTFPIGAQSNSSLSWVLYPGYNTYTFTANNISWGTNRIFMDDLSGSARFSGVSCKFFNFQVEKKNHATGFAGYGVTRTPTIIYDCSGYKRDGTILNALIIDSNSPRYKHSIKFNTTSSKIKLPAINFSGMTNTYTFSWWQYNISTGNMPWGFSDGNRLNVYHCDPLCWNTGDGANNKFKDGSTTISPTFVQNAWHHIVVTGDGTTTKLYIDGIYKGSATTYKAITGTQIYMSGWDTSTSYTFSGSREVDFRIYATCLSADQIKELYNTSMTVDSNGNIYAREVSEL